LAPGVHGRIGKERGMSEACTIATDMGVVHDVLNAVDCNTRNFARLGYQSLTSAESPFQTAITIFLTIYVAIAGYRLLFATGGARLSDGPSIALKIGAILAMLTNWSVFQTLVFNTAARAPVEIAGVISAPLRTGDSLAANPIAGLQFAYDKLSGVAADFDKAAKAGTDTDQSRKAAAAQALFLASGTLVTTSAGLIAVITVAIGILTAIGPLFVVLSLFLETRGFFIGWVRALAGAAFALLSAWSLSALMLNVLDSWLAALDLRNADGLPDVQIAITTAAIVFVFAVSQLGLLLAGLVIARGFRLSFAPRRESPAQEAIRAPVNLHSSVECTSSRSSTLADPLERAGETSVLTARSVATASASRAMNGRNASAGIAVQAPHLGDLTYRRPVPAKAGRAQHREQR
jgi:type IV secretion system protein VirB6